MNDLSVQNQTIAANKRRCEAELDHLKQDLDDMGSEARATEDKMRRAMMDASKLAEELRMEQVCFIFFITN